MYYISEINKKNIKAKEFFNEPIINIDIYFNSDLNSLDFKDYYLSGIPIPKNIITEVKKNKLVISWNIDDCRIKDFDIENVNYKIKIKGDNKTSTYEAPETNITLNDFKYNIDYEIKIRAIIDDYYGNWSEVNKIKIDEPEKHFGLFGENIQQGGNVLFGNFGGNLFG